MMKIHELFEDLGTVTLPEVASLKDLKDPKTKKYYTGVVNVKGYVNLRDKKLSKLPVKFGTVGGHFACFNNQLTSLQGAPSSVNGTFSCDNNKLTSLEGIHKLIKKLNGGFFCYNNPITSGGIGLLLIEGLTEIHADHPAFEIIKRYLGQGKKGLLRCQDELIEAGYEEFARL
jgi:hypothetical protein